MSNHTQELADLIEYFKTAKFPETPFKLNKYMIIHDDPNQFVNMEVMRIKRYSGSEAVTDSLFNHLRELKGLVEKAEKHE